MSVNKVMLVGNLAANPKTSDTATGHARCSFAVYTNETWTDSNGEKQERNERHNVVVWGRRGAACGKYLNKGRQVYIEGQLKTRSWQDTEGITRYITEVHAKDVQFLGSRSKAQDTEADGPDTGMDIPAEFAE